MAHLSLLLVAGIIAMTAAAGCPAKLVSKYEGCLAKGFKSTIGCSAELDGKSLNDKKTEACQKFEDKLVKKCDYTCPAVIKVPTAAATLPASERAVCSGHVCYNAKGTGDVYLAPGNQIWAGDRSSYLEMQTDGNLVLRCANLDIIWSSKTYESDVPNGMVFQSDGNLVLYDAGGEDIFDTGTYGKGGTRLQLQRDNNLVIYTNGVEPLWSTKTDGKC